MPASKGGPDHEFEVHDGLELGVAASPNPSGSGIRKRRTVGYAQNLVSIDQKGDGAVVYTKIDLPGHA